MAFLLKKIFGNARDKFALTSKKNGVPESIVTTTTGSSHRTASDARSRTTISSAEVTDLSISSNSCSGGASQTTGSIKSLRSETSTAKKKKKKNKKHKKSSKKEQGGCGGRKSQSRTKSKTRNKTSKSPTRSSSKPVQLRTAEALVAQWNDPNICEDEFVKLYVDPEEKCQFLEDGYHSFTPRDVARAAIMFRASFPNLQFTYDSIEVKGNKVTIEGFMCTGTHTGAPFSMIPGVYPAIPATGKHCINDEEQLCLELNDQGKIKTVRVISLGSNTGLAGFYEQIGGSLIPPTCSSSDEASTPPPVCSPSTTGPPHDDEVEQPSTTTSTHVDEKHQVTSSSSEMTPTSSSSSSSDETPQDPALPVPTSASEENEQTSPNTLEEEEDNDNDKTTPDQLSVSSQPETLVPSALETLPRVTASASPPPLYKEEDDGQQTLPSSASPSAQQVEA